MIEYVRFKITFVLDYVHRAKLRLITEAHKNGCLVLSSHYIELLIFNIEICKIILCATLRYLCIFFAVSLISKYYHLKSQLRFHTKHRICTLCFCISSYFNKVSKMCKCISIYNYSRCIYYSFCFYNFSF